MLRSSRVNGMILASASNILVWVVWVVAAFACLGSGVAVISFSNPFYSALALIGNLGSLAVLYLLLSAEFVAAAQVLVYAGAVMVMFLFVIAYLGGKADAPWTGQLPVQTIAAIVAAGALLVEIVIVIAGQADGHLSKAAEITRRVRQPRRDRAAVPHRPAARLRDHLGRPARRRGRRRDPRQPLARGVDGGGRRCSGLTPPRT